MANVFTVLWKIVCDVAVSFIWISLAVCSPALYSELANRYGSADWSASAQSLLETVEKYGNKTVEWFKAGQYPNVFPYVTTVLMLVILLEIMKLQAQVQQMQAEGKKREEERKLQDIFGRDAH